MESVSRQTLPEPNYLLRRIVTAIGVSIPMIGVLIALGLFWGVAVRPVDLALLFVFYTLTEAGRRLLEAHLEPAKVRS